LAVFNSYFFMVLILSYQEQVVVLLI